ncbi:unnamed protein product [Auanema sp. JU1783]|nr:unnamed protein product [Auanema sp. JU1783]
MVTPDRRRNDLNSPKFEKDRYRTCCNICHIKCGTVFLGAIEAMVSIFVLITVIQQIMWKNQNSTECKNSNFLRDCLIFQFSHFNVTVIFDYIVILMMIFILASILLLMCGLLSDTSCLILPHLAVQGLFLLFSLGYFLLHAWSYFYGDLYVHARPFVMQSLIERMWLAAVLLVLAAFQSYLFSAVVRCSMYISGIEESRRRRESAFERCSERVRIAKENGLWRTTSWGGGFQQYKGQYDESKPKKTAKKGFRVQWNFSQNTVLEDEVVPLKHSEQTQGSNPSPPQSSRRDSHDSLKLKTTPPSPHHQHRRSDSYVTNTVDETRKPRLISEGRRSSSSQTRMAEELQNFHKEAKFGNENPAMHQHKRNSGDSKKDFKSNGRPKEVVTQFSSQPVPQTTKSYKIEIRKTEYPKEMKQHANNNHFIIKAEEVGKHPEEHGSKLSSQSMQVKSKSASSRPPLRTYKSVDSEESEHQPSPKHERKYSGHRRRSSLSIEDGKTVTHHVRHHRSPDKKHENQLVKKISISATVHP